ncbi:MAG: peptidylprolyl isomerase [Brevinema sp.]
MLHFIKNTILCLSSLFVLSCASNQTLVSYNDVNGKTVNVSLNQAMESLEYVLSGVSPEDMSFFESDRDLLKRVVGSAVLDMDLYTIDALMISNFKADPLYQESLQKQTELLPYLFAAEKGREEITKNIYKTKVQVAEVYQIMFTNKDISNSVSSSQGTNTMTAEEIIAQLKTSTNLVEDFIMLAMTYSEEPVGSQTGGYLGYVQKGSRTDIDDVLFTKTADGLYPQIVEGKFGQYILYIKTKAKSINLEQAQQENIPVDGNQILAQYLDKQITLGFTLVDDDKIVINNKTNLISELSSKTKLVTVFGKKYTLDDLILPLQSQGMLPIETMPTPDTILKSLVSPINPAKPSQQLYRVASVLKGYSSSINNNKEFKKIKQIELRNVEFQNAIPILSEIVFKDLVTNISDAEAQKFYKEHPDQRPIIRFNDKDEPIYGTFAQSKDEIKQKIISEQARKIQDNYRSTLDQKYNVVWNEKSLDKLLAKIQKDYGFSDQISSISEVDEIQE